MKSNYKTEKYYLHFAELGVYDSLEYWFSTLEAAEEKLKELIKDADEKYGYFGFIAEVKTCVRKEKS